MKIGTEHVNKPSTHSQTKRTVLWVSFVCVSLLTFVGGFVFFLHRQVSRAESELQENPMEQVEQTDDIDAQYSQADIDEVVEQALETQAQDYQEEIRALNEQLDQFEYDDMEAVQAQLEDYRSEITSLREANEELTEANHALSETNEELSERTTVTEVQEAYEAQIEQLEEDNAELERLLERVRERLEDGQ